MSEFTVKDLRELIAKLPGESPVRLLDLTTDYPDDESYEINQNNFEFLDSFKDDEPTCKVLFICFRNKLNTNSIID